VRERARAIGVLPLVCSRCRGQELVILARTIDLDLRYSIFIPINDIYTHDMQYDARLLPSDRSGGFALPSCKGQP